MTRLKFLILALGLITVCGMQAVQLPTTSSSAYTPVTGEYSGEFDSPFGAKYIGSFHALSDYTMCPPGDILGYTSTYKKCEVCCEEQVPEEDGRAECINYCYGKNQNPLSPIDGGWWFLIVLAVLGAVFSVTLRKKLI